MKSMRRTPCVLEGRRRHWGPAVLPWCSPGRNGCSPPLCWTPHTANTATLSMLHCNHSHTINVTLQSQPHYQCYTEITATLSMLHCNHSHTINVTLQSQPHYQCYTAITATLSMLHCNHSHTINVTLQSQPHYQCYTAITATLSMLHCNHSHTINVTLQSQPHYQCYTAIIATIINFILESQQQSFILYSNHTHTIINVTATQVLTIAGIRLL